MTEEPPRIYFEVLGRPVTQGSTRTIPLKEKGGGYRTRPDGRPMLVPKHDNADKLYAWRQEVACTARAKYDGPLLVGALRVNMTFQFPRPKNHYGTGRNAGKLKASAPKYHTTRPDRLKLARSVEDALTGVLWRDDSQTVEGDTKKEYGDCYRLIVEVLVLDVELEAASESGVGDFCPELTKTKALI